MVKKKISEGLSGLTRLNLQLKEIRKSHLQAQSDVNRITGQVEEKRGELGNLEEKVGKLKEEQRIYFDRKNREANIKQATVSEMLRSGEERIKREQEEIQKTESRLEDKKRYLNDKEAELNKKQLNLDERDKNVVELKREVEINERQSLIDRRDAADIKIKARDILENAKKQKADINRESDSFAKRVKAETLRLDQKKSEVEAKEKNLTISKELLIKKEKELKTFEGWLEDRQKTQKRVWDEIQKLKEKYERKILTS